MVCGAYPFDGLNDSEIFNKVCKDNFKYPSGVKISKTCKKIISQLLDKNLNTRLELSDDIFDQWYEEE